MAMSSTRARAARVGDDYLLLVKRFPLRKIRSNAEHARALEIARELSLRGDARLTEGEADYLEALAQFISVYERETVTIPRSTPLQVLRHLMEAHQMRPIDLGKLLGSKSNATMILRGQRELSKTHIRKLADYFAVPADLFV